MSSDKTMAIPCIFEKENSEGPYEGVLVYFHPGGLPASLEESFALRLKRWKILRVELMLCATYVESVNRSGELVSSVEAVGASLFQELCTRCAGYEKTVFLAWSFGGVIAFDIANRWPELIKPRLIFVDSIAPVSSQSFSDKNISSKQTLIWFSQYLQSLKSCRLNVSFKNNGNDNETALYDLLNQCIENQSFDKNTKFVAFKKIFTTFTQGLMRNSYLTAKYKPKRYSGSLFLIRARKGLLKRFIFIRHMGWRGLVDSLTVKSLNYDHYQIVNDTTAIERVTDLSASFIEASYHSPPQTLQREVVQ